MSAFRRALFVTTLALLPGCVSMRAQEVSPEGPLPTTALINVESKSGSPLNPALLTIQVNGHATPVTSVRQVPPNAAQVALLIDDGLRSSFGNQLSDIVDFIHSMPPGMQVLVGYMRNGEVYSATKGGGFSTDHEAVADQLRLPLMSGGVDASPYFCLSEFVKHWPSNQPGARFVLMMTNGIDPYNGSTSIMNQDSPYVQTAQEDAQRAGVAVYNIYYGERGMRGGRGMISGQNYLNQVGEATGGQSLWGGLGNPVSLEPFLKEFHKDIAESYTIGFLATTGRDKPGSLERFKVKTSQPGVKLHTPEAVRPGTNLLVE